MFGLRGADAHPRVLHHLRALRRVSLKFAPRAARWPSHPEQPTPLLSDDERAVAVYQARAYLTEKLQELLPQVLADPAYKPHLEFAARCYLAHLLNKPPSRRDPKPTSAVSTRASPARWAAGISSSLTHTPRSTLLQNRKK